MKAGVGDPVAGLKRWDEGRSGRIKDPLYKDSCVGITVPHLPSSHPWSPLIQAAVPGSASSRSRRSSPRRPSGSGHRMLASSASLKEAPPFKDSTGFLVPLRV